MPKFALVVKAEIVRFYLVDAADEAGARTIVDRGNVQPTLTTVKNVTVDTVTTLPEPS